MRISDWSSDVCSSDLTIFGALWPEVYGTANLGGIRAITVSAMVFATAAGPGITGWLIDAGFDLPAQMLWMAVWCVAACFILAVAARRVKIGRASCRARVCQYV